MALEVGCGCLGQHDVEGQLDTLSKDLLAITTYSRLSEGLRKLWEVDILYIRYHNMLGAKFGAMPR